MIYMIAHPLHIRDCLLFRLLELHTTNVPTYLPYTVAQFRAHEWPLKTHNKTCSSQSEIDCQLFRTMKALHTNKFIRLGESKLQSDPNRLY